MAGSVLSRRAYLSPAIKSGDKALYAEVDSFLPLDPRFEFLRKSSLRKMV